MLTESREAMKLHKSSQMPALASLSSPQFDANPFLPPAAMCPFCWPCLALPPYRRDGAGAAVMEICRIFESRFVRSGRVALK
jgi:hypothetical protein